MSGPAKWKDVHTGTFPGLATTTSWYVEFPELYEVSIDANGIITQGKAHKCKYPMLAVGTDLQLDSIESKQVKRNNKLVDLPVGLQVNAVSIQTNEDQDYSMTEYFNFWRSLVVDDNGFYNFERFYRYDVPVRVYKRISDNPKKPPVTMSFIIKGAYPSGTIQYSYSRQAEFLNLSITLSHLGIKPQSANTGEENNDIQDKSWSLRSFLGY